MNIISTTYRTSQQSNTQRGRQAGQGPDEARDEFDNRRGGGDGPDDVRDEFDHRRDSGSSYDSWGGGGGGSDYIGGMLI